MMRRIFNVVLWWFVGSTLLFFGIKCIRVGHEFGFWLMCSIDLIGIASILSAAWVLDSNKRGGGS